MNFETLLGPVVQTQPYPLLFATVSGAHLYGFPSADSDYDLRGVHVLPLKDVIGLHGLRETIEFSDNCFGPHSIELDLVTHDVKKFFELMLKKNGYVLEQLYSPLIVHSSPEHDELKAIGQSCITRHHVHHYRGFGHNQWDLFRKESPPRVKPLLYVYRVLLTGIHLMRTGEIEANLLKLNEEFKLPYIEDLVGLKLARDERQRFEVAGLEFHATELARLQDLLTASSEKSALPDAPRAMDALNDLLVRIRLRLP